MGYPKDGCMVFQNPDNQIIGNIVEEDVGFGPENLGVPTEEIWKRVDESLKAVGMTAYRLQSPNKLSGGQKQRVAIAGVMAMKPRCIILDEPTAMLDPNGRREVIKTVHALNRAEGITVLLITHYMEEAVNADRVIVMDDGRIVMDGEPREIFSRVRELKSHGLDVPQVTELAFCAQRGGDASAGRNFKPRRAGSGAGASPGPQVGGRSRHVNKSGRFELCLQRRHSL